MAAVSFSSKSPTTTQVSEVISSSLTKSKLKFSLIPQSYTQICSLQFEEFPLVIEALLHTVKNICKIKDKQCRDYLLRKTDQKMTVVMCLPGREVTVLGCDFNLGIFFSHYVREVPFYKMVKSIMQPLTEAQNRSIAAELGQGPGATPESMVELIKYLFQFAPSRIACDALEDEGLQAPKSKYLPPLGASESASFFKELVCGNQGLFFGHYYFEIDKIAILFERVLGQLSQLGVKHLYLEYPAASLHQQFTLFNHNDSKCNDAEVQALRECLKANSIVRHEEILKICLIAKMHDIQVWPVDMFIRGLSEVSSFESAVIQRDRVILKNIRYYSSLLKEGQKYIGLFGPIHYQVALGLGIPNIRIFSEKTLHSELLSNDESENELYALQRKLYNQLNLEDQQQFENSHDVVLTIFPGEREFTLELHKK